MKMLSNIYRMSAICLMTVICGVAAAQTATIHLRVQPAGAGSLSCTPDGNSYYYSDNLDSLTVQVGQTLTLSAYDVTNWMYVGITNEQGDTITRDYTVPDTIRTAGSHTYTAHFTYHPANPGHLPSGIYDPATATLTMEAVCTSALPEYMAARAFLQDYYALADRYNLAQPYEENAGTNPVDVLNVFGCVTGTLNEMGLSEVFWINKGIRTCDLSGLTNLDFVSAWDIQSDSLSTLLLPSSLTNFCGSYGTQFIANNANLRSITLPAAEPPILYLDGDSAVYYVNDEEQTLYYQSITVYVPAESINDYQAHEHWQKFNLQPMAGATASVTVQGINTYLMKGATLTLAGDSAQMSKTIMAEQASYLFENLETGKQYTLSLSNDHYVLADPVHILLMADTVVNLQTRDFGLTYARVFAGQQEVTDRCSITWLDSVGTAVYGVGGTSPIYPIGDSLNLRVIPLGEIGTFYQEALVGYRMEPASNGIFVELVRKETHTGDTVRIATGGFDAVAYQAENSVGLLYDSLGNLVGKYSFVLNATYGHYEFTQTGFLPGMYTLVAMRESQYSSLSQLAQFAEMGLTENVNYLRNDFRIYGDSIVEVNFRAIPDFDEHSGSHLAETAFFANKNELIASQTVLLTAEVAFVEADLANISDLVYHIDLPEGVTIDEGSVMIGNNVVSYVFQDQRLTVNAGMANLASKEATRLRFYAVPTAVGEFYPSASVEYRYRSSMKAEPVGNAYFESKGITIAAPAVVLQPTFEATGYAPSYAAVVILTAAGDTIGSTSSNAVGFYRAQCTFPASESVTLVIHASASNSYLSGLLSDTTSVRFDADAARPADCFMTHQNGWYHRPMDVTWDFNNCTTSVAYYYYYHGEDFTFRTHMTGQVSSLSFVVIGLDGSSTVVPATADGNTWTATHYFGVNKVPVRVDITYEYQGETVSFRSCRSVRAIADPSGYVYEAVSSNRVEGVTASAYYKADLDSAEVLWDAAEFDQVNPLTTDYAGAYGWDVPKGWWQVRFAKAGFEPAQTEWLPVPPPQLEINVPIVRISAPVVKQISAFEDGVTIEFDRYMLPEDMTTQMITVSSGTAPLDGTITLLNEEARTAGDSVTYVSKVRFVPASGTLSGTLTIAFDTCRSYAGIKMVPVQTSVGVTLEVKSIALPDTLNLTAGQSAQFTVSALPANAAGGKTVRFDALGSSLYELSSTTAVLGTDGSATISLNGLVPGTTELRITIDSTAIEAYVPVVVVPAPEPEYFTISFVNYDGTVLQSTEVAYGETPVYAGAEPTKPATAEYTYSFTGWSPAIASVTAAAVYTAQFDSVVNTYVVTFKDWDGTVLKTDTVAYGSAATAPADPVREGYTFTGWDADYSNITGPLTVTAQYEIYNALENTEVPRATKIYRDGMVIIIRNGQEYSVHGQLLR